MIIIRPATTEDNTALLTLTALTPMQGVISLRIDRQPDFFQLLEERGKSVTFIALAEDAIVASISASQQAIWFAGRQESTWYVADFKVHPAWRGSSAGFRVAKTLADFLKKQDGDLVCLTTAAGNPKILPFLSGRLGFPKMHLAGKFSVLQIIPSRKVKPCRFQVVEEKTESEILADFYARFNTRYGISPQIKPKDFVKTTNLLAFENGKLRAALSLVDMSGMKQNVVIEMPFYLSILVSISKMVSGFLPVLRLPGKGEPIRMLNIRHFGYEEGGEEALLCLVRKARNIAFLEKHIFLSVGLHEKDTAMAIFKKFPHLPFHSNGYIGSLKGNDQKIQEVKGSLILEDFSMV